MTSPKILAIDIETAPHRVYTWGLFKPFIGIDHIIETSRVLCFSYRWLESKDRVQFIDERAGRKKMIEKAHALLDEADIVLTYNGKKFDVPTLNKEFLEAGLGPPQPYKQVDLYRTAKGQFRFASNKMDHLAKTLGIRTKVNTGGFELWVRCMAGDKKAWQKLERYNKWDVLILERLYYRLLPWIKDHPNVALFGKKDEVRTATGLLTCPTCGSKKVQARGYAVTKSHKYRRYHCTSCGSWSRARTTDRDIRPPPLVAA